MRYARDLGAGLAGGAAELARRERIGIVGLGQVMKVEDYLALRARAARGGVRRRDAGLRAGARRRSSREELEGVRESTPIAEPCFERLLEVARRGHRARDRRRDVRALLAARRRGPAVPLDERRAPARRDGSAARLEPPRDRVLRRRRPFVFSFELIGRLGYWMEFARDGRRSARRPTPGPPQRRRRRRLRAAADRMTPGATPAAVQRGMLDAVAATARSRYWSGHGLGQDVIEEPWIGLEVVQDRDVAVEWRFDEGMVLAMPPLCVVDRDGARHRLHGQHLRRRRSGGGEPVSQTLSTSTSSRCAWPSSRPDPRLRPAAARARDHAARWRPC